MATLTTWYNPFKDHGNDNLLSISSGKVTTEAVFDDLLCAYIVGKERQKAFISE